MAKGTTHPTFAVVGHPNKGKSSIVSALALDDSVDISMVPGTTYQARSFPLRVDGKVLYELIDTPGFQRARRVLAWLQGHEVSADRRHEVVEAFVQAHLKDKRFHDEIALLQPILAGAGILYVVDASKPYGDEYEAEMEILRWSGQPSMALINQIGSEDYSEAWCRALGQYFKMIRRFNPMEVSLEQHIGILESMAQLKEQWITPMKEAISIFQGEHQKKIEQSSVVIGTLVVQAMSLVERYTLQGEEETSEERASLEEKYKKSLRRLELESQAAIEALWHHNGLEKEQHRLSFEAIDLFSEKSASLFGLTQKELLVAGATSGAVTGAGIDLVFAGHTLLLGGAIGALVGGVGAYFGFDELSEIKVLGTRLGKRYLETGPMKNRNFPYILLGRAIYHMVEVATHSHARRESIDLESEDTHFKERWLEDGVRKSLEKYHKIFRKGSEVSVEERVGYQTIIDNIIKKMIE